MSTSGTTKKARTHRVICAMGVLLLIVVDSPGAAEPPAEAGAATQPVKRTRAQVEALIAEAGRTPPSWWDSVALNYPPTLDLSWKKIDGWDNQRNVGQYLWDIVAPNPGRWKEGVKLVHHVLFVNKDNPEAIREAMQSLSHMYGHLLEDYPRAAFWALKHGRDPILLADCYWKMGCKEMAAGILLLSLFRPRFWCRHVCPTGAVFSIFNLLRIAQRKVESSCISCERCVRICPFDAIKPTDDSTRTADCTLCQTCAGVCPTHSIKFVPRSNSINLKPLDDAPPAAPLSRRSILAGALGGSALAMGIRQSYTPSLPIVRPPGSVPESDFLRLCIRCGECFKVCPNNVLQPAGFDKGLNNLWTPQVIANWSGCEPSCNNCGQVCPTAAIHPLPVEEKRVARMGLAVVNERSCLPHAQREACQMCVDECNAAGYNAIEFRRVGVQLDDQGNPVEGSGFLAPVVLSDRCVGCGLCQTRCHMINVKQKHLLARTAIEIFAGDGREDRLRSGSYIALRQSDRVPEPGDGGAS